MQKIRKILRAVSEKTELPTNQPTNQPNKQPTNQPIITNNTEFIGPGWRHSNITNNIDFIGPGWRRSNKNKKELILIFIFFVVPQKGFMKTLKVFKKLFETP